MYCPSLACVTSLQIRGRTKSTNRSHTAHVCSRTPPLDQPLLTTSLYEYSPIRFWCLTTARVCWRGTAAPSRLRVARCCDRPPASLGTDPFSLCSWSPGCQTPCGVILNAHCTEVRHRTRMWGHVQRAFLQPEKKTTLSFG